MVSIVRGVYMTVGLNDREQYEVLLSKMERI
jgi:hypothetical protein